MAKIILNVDDNTGHVEIIVPKSMPASEAHELLVLAAAVTAEKAGATATLDSKIEARRNLAVN